MRLVLATALLLATPAFAQTQAPGTTVTGEPRARSVPTVTDAPVPSVSAPAAATGGAGAVPERIAPADAGTLNAGPANATPFSGAPTGTGGSGGTNLLDRGGASSAGSLTGTPNLSK